MATFSVGLRARIGLASAIPNLSTGELGYATDTGAFYVGYGTGNTRIGPCLTSLNGLTGVTQTFSRTNDTNVTLTLSSAGTDHSFTMDWSGVLAVARGGTNSSAALANGKVMASSGGAIVETGTILVSGTALTLGTSGGTIGVFGATPVARPDAYTQTYADATRTFSAYTADDQSGAYTGIDNAQGGTPYATVTDVNALRDAYETLRAFCENGFSVLNQVVDDLQERGDFQ